MTRLLMWILISLSMSLPALSATVIVLEPGSTSRVARIIVEDAIAPGDEVAFANIASQIDKAIVLFSGEGGNLATALQIGEIIRDKEFETLVVEGADCGGACAVAWLAGNKRYMQQGALVSFAGVREDTQYVDAVDSYFVQLALSSTITDYIGEVSSQVAHWLTFEEALSRNFDVAVLNEPYIAEDPVIVEPEIVVAQPKPKLVPQPAPQKNFRTVAGVDLFGYDLSGMPLRDATWSSCSNNCTLESACNAFTFNSKSHTCFLKSFADFAVRYEPASSGFIAKLAGGIRQSDINVLQRTDVIGNDYNHLDRVSLETCLRSCDSDSSCVAFSFIAKTRQCWMKDSMNSTQAKVGVVSGTK